MSSIIADYTSGANLLEGLHTFLTKGHTLRPSFTGTGNGYCDDAIGTTSSVHEIITLTFTSATAFSVSGSVSGSMGTGATATLFTHARFQCTIQVGTVAWVAGDTITWTMTAPWEIVTYTSGQSYIYTAPGDDGNQDVNVGWTVKSNSTGGYYGVRMGAYPTILPAGGFWRSNTLCWMPLGSYSGSNVRLIAVASGQACWFCAVIGTYYMHAVAGYADIPGTLDTQPAPYIIGAARCWTSEPVDTSTDWLYTNSVGGPLYPTDPRYNGGENYGYGGSLFVRNSTNKWSSVSVNYNYDPNAYATSCLYKSTAFMSRSALGPNLDGSMPCFPYVIDRYPPPANATTVAVYPDIYGSIPFVWLIPSYDASGNLLLSQSTFRSLSSRSKMMVLQTKNDSSDSSLFALEMF